MALTEMMIKVPEQMVSYINSDTKQAEQERNAMIMYPYIKNGIISHGRAAQIIGMRKWDLITLYNELGFPYLSSVDDYKDDLKTIEEIFVHVHQ